MGCALALAAVVAVGALRQPAVETGPATEPPGPDPTVCAVLEAAVVLLTAGVPPPLDASPTEIDAARRLNAVLAQRRETILGLDTVRKMGC